ncbi:hypothetical protein [Lysinibacillus sp. NPDC093688]
MAKNDLNHFVLYLDSYEFVAHELCILDIKEGGLSEEYNKDF